MTKPSTVRMKVVREYPIDMVFDYLKKNPEKEFTTTQLSKKLNLSQQQIRNATRQLRARDMIRFGALPYQRIQTYKYDKYLEKRYNEI